MCHPFAPCKKLAGRLYQQGWKISPEKSASTRFCTCFPARGLPQSGSKGLSQSACIHWQDNTPSECASTGRGPDSTQVVCGACERGAIRVRFKLSGILKTSRPHVNAALRIKPGAAHQSRHGDWAMRMRFWGENTRETEAAVCKRLPTRAFHPKARSHSPITVPSAVGSEIQTFHYLQRRQLLTSPRSRTQSFAKSAG